MNAGNTGVGVGGAASSPIASISAIAASIASVVNVTPTPSGMFSVAPMLNILNGPLHGALGPTRVDPKIPPEPLDPDQAAKDLVVDATDFEKTSCGPLDE